MGEATSASSPTKKKMGKEVKEHIEETLEQWLPPGTLRRALVIWLMIIPNFLHSLINSWLRWILAPRTFGWNLKRRKGFPKLNQHSFRLRKTWWRRLLPKKWRRNTMILM